jgi:cytochrome c-type biogenesis protein CcmH/NrfG
MARGAAQTQRKQRAETTPKKKQAPPSWEDQLFFSRLRRHAKWVYVALAVVFGAGFIFLGIGSGSSGISDTLRNLLTNNGGSSTSSQIKDARKTVAAHPKDMEAYLNLSTLYQQDQNTAAAIATLERAAKVQPRNLDVLNRLAGIYRGQAESALNVAAGAQGALAANNATPPGLSPSSQLGQALASDPVSKALSQKANETFVKMTTAFSKAQAASQRVATAARGTAQEANAQLQLGSVAIESLRLSGSPTDAQTAAAAYQRYLTLEPKGTSAALARQTIAQLRSFLPKSQG